MDNNNQHQSMLSLAYDDEMSGPAITSIHKKLYDFNNVVFNESLGPKLHEDDKFNKINETLSMLYLQLKRETQERLNSRESLQQLTENAVNDMLNDVQLKLTSRINTIAVKLNDLINSFVALESIVGDIDKNFNSSDDIQLIQNDLNDLNRNIKNDIALKLDKDASLVDKLSSLDYSIKSKINDGVILGTEGLKDINNDILQFKEMLDNGNDVLRHQIMEQLDDIKQALELTTKARTESDCSIIQAIDQMLSILPATNITKNACRS